MFNIIARISTLLALKALPDEVALRSYIEKIFKGIVFLMIGSVLFGAIISASLYVLYDQMLIYGYQKVNVLIIVFGIAFIVMIICFLLAKECLSEKFSAKEKPKNIIDEKLYFIKSVISESIIGFLEGLLESRKNSTPKTKKRR